MYLLKPSTVCATRLKPIRAELLQLLRRRGATVIDRDGRDFPSLLICRYRDADMVIAVMPRRKKPSVAQWRAIRIARARRCLAFSAWDSESVEDVLDAIDDYRE